MCPFLRVSSPSVAIFSAFFTSILKVYRPTFLPILRAFEKKESVFSPPLRSFLSVVASLLSAVALFVSAVVRAAAITRLSASRA